MHSAMAKIDNPKMSFAICWLMGLAPKCPLQEEEGKVGEKIDEKIGNVIYNLLTFPSRTEVL